VELEGPFSLLDQLKDAPGVFALLCLDPESGSFQLLEVRTAALVQREVAESLREVWTEVCKGKLRVAAVYGEHQLDQIKLQILQANALR